MERSSLTPPNQSNYQYGYDLALKLASQKLAIINIEEQCQKAVAKLKISASKKIITLEYLNSSYQIVLPEMDIILSGSQEPVQPRERLLMLHYLVQASGNPITGKKITFKELPDGASYFPTFYKRAIKPLVDNFGQEPQRLLDAATKIGGHRADYGDLSVVINALSRVPLILVLWYGDDELAPEGSILFDSTISSYLSTEDITVLCETIAWRLVKMPRGQETDK
jgi:hypothetical protein